MNALEIIRSLKAHYRTGTDQLGSDFFAPCLKEATRYRRSAGYFSSTALLTWAEALPRVIENNTVKIQLIASRELSLKDIATLKELTDESKKAAYQLVLADQVLEEIIELIERPGDEGLRAKIFAWLVANGRLELRFAFPKHVEGAGIFHEKIGVFDFPNADHVAFTGSANETLGGHQINYESIDVYRSWLPGEEERVQTKIDQFDEAWNNKAAGLDVREPTADVVARLKARAPSQPPGKRPSSEDRKWRHQLEATEIFLKKRAGVLEMATGTGKTRTALKILDRLIDAKSIEGAVISMEGTDLLDQWTAELDAWNFASNRRWRVYRHYERHKELGDFSLDPQNAILVISREQLGKVLPRLTDLQKAKMIVVHDEVHGLGVPTLVKSLVGQHAKFGWRLGLSATPERPYGQEGNDFILSEIGPIIFQFPLELAIARGVLSSLDYIPLEYELTDGDRQRLRDVYAKQAARMRAGNAMSPEEVWTEISRVYKTAEMKPAIFFDYIQDHPEVVMNSIIFVETKEYGNALLERLHGFTTRYRTYYAEDDRDHLIEFAKGDIDCLVTCHRISQGIDIRALKSVVLFASARAKLETIQRIGRCLRADPTNPGKRALVLDFVRPASSNDKFQNADQERFEWLTSLSRIERAPDA